MNLKEQRKKEDNAMARCLSTDPKKNADIGRMIKHVINSGNKVYLGTDWHLWKRDDDNPKHCHKHSDFDNIINHARKTIGDKDLLIFLGDLVDGEFIQEELLKETLLTIPGSKILVRGNNDLFSYEFYRSCGFRYVVQSFIYTNILFSHAPLTNDCVMNIHGHIHNYKTYWIPYTNHIDVLYNATHKLNELDKIIKSIDSYKKKIHDVSEEHMTTEGYTFLKGMLGSDEIDPYNDFCEE